jgi:hypothetical protein
MTSENRLKIFVCARCKYMFDMPTEPYIGMIFNCVRCGSFFAVRGFKASGISHVTGVIIDEVPKDVVKELIESGKASVIDVDKSGDTERFYK